MIHKISPPGFTLLEVSLASSMSVFLAVLVSAAWSGMGRSLWEAQARCRINEDANRCAAFLADDFGGQLGTSVTGNKKKGKKAGRVTVGTTELRLCFDGGSDPNGTADWGYPDTIVVYALRSGTLVRENQTSNTTVTLARNVKQFSVLDQGTQVTINVTLAYRGLERIYKFVGKD